MQSFPIFTLIQPLWKEKVPFRPWNLGEDGEGIWGFMNHEYSARSLVIFLSYVVWRSCKQTRPLTSPLKLIGKEICRSADPKAFIHFRERPCRLGDFLPRADRLGFDQCSSHAADRGPLSGPTLGVPCAKQITYRESFGVQERACGIFCGSKELGWGIQGAW